MDLEHVNGSNHDGNAAMEDSSSDMNSDGNSDTENATINIRDGPDSSETEKHALESSVGSTHIVVCGCVPQKDLYHLGGCFLLVLVALGITGIYILYQGKCNTV